MIAKGAVTVIRKHGRECYPNECCGVLVGITKDQEKKALEAVPMENLRLNAEEADLLLPRESPDLESERNRFLINPKEQLRIERETRARGWKVLGYYHSHPDHPACPSNYDRDHGWPWYSYVILSVIRGNPEEMTSWVLKDDRSSFNSEPWAEF